jgi:two-component system chemotaxis response regulator CheY
MHTGQPPSLNEVSVLLIEDDASTRDILAVFLDELGVKTIHQMSNGTDALKFMDDNPEWRGVVLCDWNMPKMSGASFYRQVKNTHSDIPFIMVTGRNDEDSVLFAKDSGIYAYLLKPVSIEQLQEKIGKVVINHAAHFTSTGNYSSSLYSI